MRKEEGKVKMEKVRKEEKVGKEKCKVRKEEKV